MHSHTLTHIHTSNRDRDRDLLIHTLVTSRQAHVALFQCLQAHVQADPTTRYASSPVHTQSPASYRGRSVAWFSAHGFCLSLPPWPKWKGNNFHGIFGDTYRLCAIHSDCGMDRCTIPTSILFLSMVGQEAGNPLSRLFGDSLLSKSLQA